MPHKATKTQESHPARGAWIEISRVMVLLPPPFGSHPARGAWIEIVDDLYGFPSVQRRTPQGVRGLKFLVNFEEYNRTTSHPARGAWIEMPIGD